MSDGKYGEGAGGFRGDPRPRDHEKDIRCVRAMTVAIWIGSAIVAVVVLVVSIRRFYRVRLAKLLSMLDEKVDDETSFRAVKSLALLGMIDVLKWFAGRREDVAEAVEPFLSHEQAGFRALSASVIADFGWVNTSRWMVVLSDALAAEQMVVVKEQIRDGLKSLSIEEAITRHRGF